MAVNEQELEEKIITGAELTKEESDYVLSYPNPDTGNAVQGDVGKEEEDKEEDIEDIEKEKTPEAKAKEKKGEETAKPGEKKGEEETPASEKKGEETEKGKTAAPGTEEKKAEEKKEKPTENLADKLNKELDKPDGQEDLSDFSDREKGLYYALKTERNKRQKAEEDRDAERFQRVKKEKEEQAAIKTATAKKEAEDELNKALGDIEGDEEEFISKGQLKKVLTALQKVKEATSSEKEEDASKVRAQNRKDLVRFAEMGARDIIETRRIKGEDAPDYDKVMELGPDIIEINENYKQQIAQAFKTGKNPAILVYDLIRKDPKFTTLYKPGTASKEEKKPEEKKPEDKGKETLNKIDKNLKKPITSGAAGGGSGEIKDSKGNVYTIVQLVNMNSSDFRKVPKEVREKFLKTF